MIGNLATRLAGSSDLYQPKGRRPYASINFVTCHDGFTLNDLVSYNNKHNVANLEGNCDGESHNRSWNCGAEGPTDNARILALRACQRRNFLATLLLSQGVPMLLAGDESGRTQHGNNNAYCQDNPLSWLNWELSAADLELLDFTRRLIRLRKQHPVFRRRHFFQGQRIRGTAVRDVLWLNPNGKELTRPEWQQPFALCLGMYLSGRGLLEQDAQGQPIVDDDFLLLLNAEQRGVRFVLPRHKERDYYDVILDTGVNSPPPGDRRHPAQEPYSLQGHSLVLLSQPR